MGRGLDPDCLSYLEHWEPVLAAAAERTLDRLAEGPPSLLDLGAGTGSLTLAALRRWPSAHVTALDASGAMLAVARSRLAAGDQERVSWLSAEAADIPLPAASVDAVVSSFVLQLLEDRPAALTEIARVLRPGGAFSFVTWLADDLDLPADVLYHDVLGDVDLENEESEPMRSPVAGDYDSLQQARDELLAAGFEVVEVRREELHHTWTASSYLAFKLDYDDVERISTLGTVRREQLVAELVARLSALEPEAFELHGPLVAAVARRPA